MNRIFIALSCVALSLAGRGLVDDQPYCAVRYRRLCQGKGRHVGCQFPESGAGLSCRNYSPIQFHNDLKNFITHYLNRRRQRIAAGNERVRGGMHLPKPEIMMMVEWDRELASLAQRLADQCSFVHDDCRATVRYPYAGQTVGEVRWRRSSDSDDLTAQRAIRRVFDAWWGERRRVQPQQLTTPFRLTAKGAVWGHFSQLAVWSLRAVGCGAVRHGTTCPRMLLVCDFSHTNMLGQRTLTPGPPAPCPVHTARRSRSPYPALCAPVRQRLRLEQYDVVDLEEEPPPDRVSDDEGDTYSEPTAAQPLPMRNVTRHRPRVPYPPTTRQMTQNWLSKMRVSTKASRDQDYEEDASMKSVMLYRNSRSTRETTKGIFIDKLDRELDSRLKAQHKYFKFNNWESRPTIIMPSDETTTADLEEFQTMPIKSRKMYVSWNTDGQTSVGIYSEEALDGANASSRFEPPVRHKWQQSRNRPLRPGASALLNMPVTAHTRPSSIVAMMLDKEDVDQLFRDTGFNPKWMRQRL